MIPFPPDKTPIWEVMSELHAELQDIARLQKIITDNTSKKKQSLDLLGKMASIVKNFDPESPTHALTLKSMSQAGLIKGNATPSSSDFKSGLLEHTKNLKNLQAGLDSDIANFQRNRKVLLAKSAVFNALNQHVRGPLLRTLVKSKHELFDQQKFFADESQTAGLGFEYIHWRRAGLTVTQSLEKLRSPESKRRISGSQASVANRWVSSAAGGGAMDTQDSEVSRAYILAYAQHFNRLKHDFKSASNPQAGFAGTVAGKLTSFGTVVPAFSFATLTYMWPVTIYRPWFSISAEEAWDEFERRDGFPEFLMTLSATTSSSITSTSTTSSSSTTTTSASSSLAQKKSHMPLMAEEKKQAPIPRVGRSPVEGIVYSEADMMAQIDDPSDRITVMREEISWKKEIDQALGDILNAEGARGHIICIFRTVQKRRVSVVIDLNSAEAGIFDPHFGFLSIPSKSSYPGVLTWLLGLLTFWYAGASLEFLHVGA